MGDLKKPRPVVYAGDPVGRNQPCPCGSGEKFKRCCLVKARASGQFIGRRKTARKVR